MSNDDNTPLDAAYLAMAAGEATDTARLGFYERLADGELYLLLETEAEGDSIAPRLFTLEEGVFVLVFDREERLTRFTAGPAPYAALSGRRIVRQLAGQGIGLALNLGGAPSEMMLPCDAVDWLAETLAHSPRPVSARIAEVAPPRDVPDVLLTALDAKLATMSGLAGQAYLAEATYESGARGHLLAFVDPRPGAEPALAQAVSEALTFSGIEAGALDVTMLSRTAPLSPALARHGLAIHLPKEPAPKTVSPSAPGSDPDRPPRLR